MIPAMNIIAWGRTAPWAEQRQIEQDLIISRALVELFSDSLLRERLRFRGGTALNKLHFPKPLRYSEDIDLVRTEASPVGTILNRVRDVLKPWLGEAQVENKDRASKLRFRVPSEDNPAVDIRLKIEINTREIEVYDRPHAIGFKVENPWFSGETKIPTFTPEEMLSTKLRALLQRDKGRDLFDLAHALEIFSGLNTAGVVSYFYRYLEKSDVSISRAEAEQRMFAKLQNPGFLTDMRPLLTPDQTAKLTDEEMRAAFVRVFRGFITSLRGDPWKKTTEMIEQFGLQMSE
jgi:predicted nucleotidyltransferase component of viral defense system